MADLPSPSSRSRTFARYWALIPGLLMVGSVALAVLSVLGQIPQPDQVPHPALIPGLAGTMALLFLGLTVNALQRPPEAPSEEPPAPPTQAEPPQPDRSAPPGPLDRSLTYDLFISYARADNAAGTGNPQWLQAFLARLNAAHRKKNAADWFIFHDHEEIHGMQDWENRLLDGLKQAHAMLAMVTPRYLGSEPCQWEWETLTQREADEGLGRSCIYPLQLQPIPVFTSAHGQPEKAADLTDWLATLERRPQDPVTYRNALAQRIGDLFARQQRDLAALFARPAAEIHTDPQLSPLFEEMDDELYLALDRIRRTREAKGNVPGRNRFFVGRESELRALRDLLFRKRTGILTAVRSLGGLGKTALAHRYAEKYRADYPGGSWFLECEGLTGLDQALAQLHPHLGIILPPEAAGNPDLVIALTLQELKKATMAEVKNAPGTTPACLLIFDNVDQPDLLSPQATAALSGETWLHLLATTRLEPTQLFPTEANREIIDLHTLPDEDALTLIRLRQPGQTFSSPEEEAAARELPTELRGFTLAVQADAVYLAQYAEVTCADFLARIRAEGGLPAIEAAAGDEAAAAMRHQLRSLSLTLGPTLDGLAPPELHVLRLAALLPPDTMALEWLRAVAGETFPELASAQPGHKDPWLALVRRLTGLQLLTETSSPETPPAERLVRMHRLIQDLVRQRWETEAAPALDQATNQLLAHARQREDFIGNSSQKAATAWELSPLQEFATLLTSGESPQDGATIFANNVAARLWDSARYLEAEPLMRRALAIDEASLGPDHPDVARDLNNLAQLLQATNRLDEAEPLMRRTLAIVEATFGPDHPYVAISLNNMVQLLRATNRRAEVEAMARRALAINEATFGPDHPNVARDLNNLAKLLQYTNRLGEAEPLMRRALAIDEASFGPDHPYVAISLNNLADLLHHTNRLGEAEPLKRRALAIDEASFGPDHPNVAIDLNNLALLLQATNRLGEAEPLMRRHVEIFRQFGERTGHEHPHMRAAEANYAALRKAMEDE